LGSSRTARPLRQGLSFLVAQYQWGKGAANRHRGLPARFRGAYSPTYIYVAQVV